MRARLGLIRLNKFMCGKGKTKMYNLTPAVFLGLMDDPTEKDWIIGIDWLLWTAYLQIATLKK